MRTINSEYRKNPLVDFFANDDLSKNYLLYAGGGYGKTTAMLCLNEFLLEKAKQGEKIVPLFIDVKELDSEYGKSNILIDYIRKNYCGNETNATEKGKSNAELLELLFEGKLNYTNKERYRFVVLLDGFNEATKDMQNTLVNEINTLKTNDNVKFVVSSRTDDFNIDFKRIVLNGLSEEQIVKFLENKFSNDFDVNKISKSLLEILQVPLFLDVFSKTYDDNLSFPDIYEEKSVRKANILNSYVNKILSDIDTKSETRKEVLEFTLNYWLPAVAFEMSKEKSFRIGSNTPAKLLDSDYFINRLGYDDEEIRKIKNSEFFYPKTICEKDFSLISTSNGNLQFNHHIWRDFFAAKHITNILRLNPEYITEEALKNLEITLDETIYRFVGELITDENGRCECDFERKRDLENPSPIESFMQNVQRKKNKLSATATKNLIKIMKVSRNNYITAMYDNLDLSETSFLNCDLPNSSFKNAVINEFCFIAQLKETVFSKTVFSNNGRFLCCVSIHTGHLLTIFDFENNQIFHHYLDSFLPAESIIDSLDIQVQPQNENDFIVEFESVAKKYYLNINVGKNSVSISQIEKKDELKIKRYTIFDRPLNFINVVEKFNLGEYSFGLVEEDREKIEFFKNGILVNQIPARQFGEEILCFDGRNKIAVRRLNDIVVWDLENGQKTVELFGECDILGSCEQNLLICDFTDNRIRCFSELAKLKKVFRIPDDNILKIEQFANSRCLLVCGITNLYTINIENGNVLLVDRLEDIFLTQFYLYENLIIADIGLSETRAVRVYTFEHNSPEKLVFMKSIPYKTSCGKIKVNTKTTEIFIKQTKNSYKILNYSTGEVYDGDANEIFTETVDTPNYNSQDRYKMLVNAQEKIRITNAILPLNRLGTDFSESVLKEPYTEDWLNKAFYEQLQDNGAKVPEEYTTAEGFYTFD